MQVMHGTGRIAIQISKMVFKVPKNLNGYISNIIETINWWKYKPYRTYLCPVWFNLFGIIEIMPYCSKVTSEEIIQEKNLCEFVEQNYDHPLFKDMKNENLGWRKGKIVKIDYGLGNFLGV
jgi:hypothetical protein